MPKVVDHEARRQLIADALLAVVRREGVGAVSVRSVAGEAGLSVGAMRHTAASQDELVAFAMRVVADRVGARVVTRVGGWDAAHQPGVDDLVDLCGEVLPLDDERAAEAAVWVELVTLARTDARLAEVSAQAHAGLRALADRVVTTLLPDADRRRHEAEAVRLHALLDGLTLHVVLQPAATDLGSVRAVVQEHLLALAHG